MNSLGAAFDKICKQLKSRKLPPTKQSQIILTGGSYSFSDTLDITPPNQGTNAGSILISAAPGERPVLNGGVGISGWRRNTGAVPDLPEAAAGQVWVADAPMVHGKILQFRQLWVNGHRAVLARNPNGSEMERLIGWSKTNQTAVISSTVLQGITRPAHLEMVVDQVWEIAILRLKSIRLSGSNAFITFHQPESKIEFEHPWPPVIVNTKYQAPFFLANAMAFLDSPGEWYEDVKAGKVYYWPRDDEDMTRAEVYAPNLTTLVEIKGTLNQPACNIQFKGITFAYTTWLRPSKQGHVPLQAGMFMLDAKKLSTPGTPYHRGLDNLAWIGRPPAAVSVKNAQRVSFEDCTFEHLGSAGLDFLSASTSNLVQGCVFRDIGGNGIQLGEYSQPDVETHVPFYPSDYRLTCADNTIDNNLFTNCGVEDWGCMGISVGYSRNTAIRNNEVCNMPYTGISVGWGWTKHLNAARDNLIAANHIHHVGQMLGDLGGIYTLSAQPGTIIAENYIHDITPSPYVPDPEHWFYLYLDEGSSYITVRDNWCPSEKFLKNANGPGNVWTNNGPQVSEAIKDAAGLEPKYRTLLK